MKPWLSSENWPLREYWVAPLTVVRKKPPPLMAMSSGLLDDSMLPWVNCWAICATLVPMPAWLPPTPLSELA
jgi:hypothetical protein